MNPGSVAVVVVEDIGVPSWDLYELSIPCTVFGKPQPDLADPWYDLRLCSTGSLSRTALPPGPGCRCGPPTGSMTSSAPTRSSCPRCPTPASTKANRCHAALITALRQAYDAGARMVSLCTGAFALAEAGLLDGRRATAHWMHTAQLAERYPKVEVDDSVLYVDDGDVLTSAGLTMRPRPLPPSGAPRPGRTRRQSAGPSDGGARPPARRPGPVHRPVRARHRRREPGARSGLGPYPPGPTPDGRGSGPARGDEPAHPPPATPGSHRNDSAPVAPQPAPRTGSEPAGINRLVDREGRGTERPRHGEQPPPPLPQTDRGVAERLSAGLPRTMPESPLSAGEPQRPRYRSIAAATASGDSSGA